MTPTAISSLPTTEHYEGVSTKHPIPSPLQLHAVFNMFLIRSANLSAQYVNSSTEDISQLPVEKSIYFSDPFEGLLVVRGGYEFEKFLQKECDGSFLEMTVLFWHQLFLQSWRLDTRGLRPALFKSSAPVHWPDRKPDTACTVFIKEFPVEIRLWTPVDSHEMKAWHQSKS